MKKVKIFTDSACDLDNEVLLRYGVTCLPLTVLFEDQMYKDRVDIEPSEFYAKLSETKEMPTTAMINPGQFQTAFAKALSDDPEAHILYLAFASTLSGTYESACLAQSILGNERITVINTYAASVGLGLMVLEAAQMADQGAEIEEIVLRMEDMVSRLEQVFIVGNLEMLKRGGRVNAAAAVVGDLLNIKLILGIPQGIITPLEKVRGMKKAQKRVLELIAEKVGAAASHAIGISYAKDLDAALAIQAIVEEKFHCKTILTQIGPVIGAHVGIGTLAFFFLRENKN